MKPLRAKYGEAMRGNELSGSSIHSLALRACIHQQVFASQFSTLERSLVLETIQSTVLASDEVRARTLNRNAIQYGRIKRQFVFVRSVKEPVPTKGVLPGVTENAIGI